MTWLLLILAGLLEIGFAVSLKLTHGFTRLVPSVLFVTFGAASFILLSLALRSLPVGTAYAVWTGIGAAGTAAVGMFFLGDPATATRLLCLSLIVVGVVGLRIVS